MFFNINEIKFLWQQEYDQTLNPGLFPLLLFFNCLLNIKHN